MSPFVLPFVPNARTNFALTPVSARLFQQWKSNTERLMHYHTISERIDFKISGVTTSNPPVCGRWVSRRNDCNRWRTNQRDRGTNSLTDECTRTECKTFPNGDLGQVSRMEELVRIYSLQTSSDPVPELQNKSTLRRGQEKRSRVQTLLQREVGLLSVKPWTVSSHDHKAIPSPIKTPDKRTGFGLKECTADLGHKW